MNNLKIKNYFKTSIILVFLISFINISVLSQTKFVSIHYKDKEYVVGHDVVCFIVKEKYYNDELLKKFKELNYEIALTLPKFRSVFLRTDGKSNILEHYYKFEKEKYVDSIIRYKPGTAEYQPNDTEYQNNKQYALIKLNMSNAWNHTTGDTSLRIAVLDSGIPMQNGSLSHGEFPDNGRILLGLNYVTTTPNNNVTDDRGHGTKATI